MCVCVVDVFLTIIILNQVLTKVSWTRIIILICNKDILESINIQNKHISWGPYLLQSVAPKITKKSPKIPKTFNSVSCYEDEKIL